MSKDLKVILIGCRKQEHGSQKQLYNLYKSVLFAICRRYMGNIQDAEDVFAVGFVKIFSKIDSFKGHGSFEGWMKRVMINECLMQLRKNKKFKNQVDLEVIHPSFDEYYDEEMDVQLILKSMEGLPPGYRTVLNLYAVEGYKHREIAELLDISINTSKSQLILARKKMKTILKKNLDIDKLNWRQSV